ncbi:hypothetical protein DL990_40410 [Amycolatopsis sp. WAC 01416]|nr:hypothetical protein DL990_40410 [Amycolatopsis sp. WAC 01416]
MDVCPGAEFARRLERLRVLHGDERQRLVRDEAVREFGRGLGQHDQREPRCQPFRRVVRFRGAVAPGEVLVIELDVGQEVRLEIGDARPRLGAGDGSRIDADDVTRPVELQRLGEFAEQRGLSVLDRVAGQSQSDRDARARPDGVT